MLNRQTLFALIVFFVAVPLAVAQPPNQDNERWSSGTALSQTQGFSQGSPLRLTWGFAALNTPINDSQFSGFANANNTLQNRLNQIYGNQNVWQPLFQSVFDRWSAVSGLSYTYEANDDGAAFFGAGNAPAQGISGVRADVRIAGKPLDGNSGVLAYNYFPNVADMVIDTTDNTYNNLNGNSLVLRNIVSHEHGHGVGMRHFESNNANGLMEPFLNTAFDGPQFHDILVAQRWYGDVNEKSFNGLGNDVAARATSLGTILDQSTVSIGNDATDFVVAPNDVDFVSIDDNTDTDFYSFTLNIAGTVDINLNPLGPTYNITAQGGPGNVAFNSQLRSNLSLALFDTNGTSLLQLANATSFGGSESILGYDLAAGTYFIRVTGVDNPDSIALDAQFYRLGVSFIAIPEPGACLAMTLVSLVGVLQVRRRRVA